MIDRHIDILFIMLMVGLVMLIVALTFQIVLAIKIKTTTLPLSNNDTDQITSCDDPICIKDLKIAALDETLNPSILIMEPHKIKNESNQTFDPSQ
jgi:flagellar basal body-associated protein FliL